MKKTAKAPSTPREPRIRLSDSNITKAAVRLLNQKLVSTEIQYVQRQLGTHASQQQLDDQVVAVRSLPWSEIAIAD